MAQVIILGAGVMGGAFTFPLADAGNSVRLVGTHLDTEIVDEVRSTGRHPGLGVDLPELVEASHWEDLPRLFSQEVDLVVLGVSSAGVDWAIEQLGPVIRKGTPVLMLTKGLAEQAGELGILPDTVSAGLEKAGISEIEVGAIGGPCVAAELAHRRPSGVVIGYRDAGVLGAVRELLGAPYYLLHQTTDLIGLEVCAAMKNFFAIAVGAAAVGENDTSVNNPAALLFSRSLEEMAFIVEYMGGSRESVYGLAGTGDFYVTCLAGRNSRMGRLLGRGLTYREAKDRHMPDDTVEGAELAFKIEPAIRQLFRRGVFSPRDLSVTGSLLDAICTDRPLRIPWDEL